MRVQPVILEDAALKSKLKLSFFDRTDDFIFSTDNQTVHLDADKLSMPLSIRPWKPGDSFYPLGMKGKKKLSDFLIDQKINLFQKEDIQVVTSKGEIVWIVELRIDDRFKVTERTKRIAELKVVQPVAPPFEE